jgi:hypothetical protein
MSCLKAKHTKPHNADKATGKNITHKIKQLNHKLTEIS